MKTLIVGAKGMLGSMLGQVFAEHAPVSWDKEEIDIAVMEQVRNKVKGLMPELIINAAAYTNVDGAETDKETVFAVNELGVANLATVAQEIDALLVHYSTDYVFPGDKKEGYAEHDPPGPAVNVYGQSKLAGERALSTIKPRYYLLRTAWLYGPGGRNFVTTMLQLAQEHKLLSVVSDQYGCPTFTKDLAQATRAIIEQQYPLGIYHTVNDGVASWFEFAQKIFEYSDITADIKPTTSAEFPRPAKRPAYSILLNTKGPRLRRWQQALDEYVRLL